MLHEAHLGVRRHLKAAKLHQPQPARAAVGRVQLVDAPLGPMRVARNVNEQIAKDAIDQPG